MKNNYLTLLLVAATAMLFACSKDVMTDPSAPMRPLQTRTNGNKTPKIIGIVETNDTDPRNVLSYRLGDSISGPCFFDIVEFFAANIHKDQGGDPAIYFNPELAPLMGDTTTYIKPLKDAGVKAILSILGDWKGIGVANLSEDQAEKLTDILVHIVKTYGLDGISIDDEYANYTSTVAGSFGRVIKKLRAKLDAEFPAEHKIIGVDQWGNYQQIDQEAGGMIDYVYHGSFGPNSFPTSSYISGVSQSQFAPQILNLGNNYNRIYLNQIKMRSKQAADGGYGGITLFNLRIASEVSPLPVFQAIAEGAYQSTVTYDGTEYPQNWTFIPGGKVIAYNDLPSVDPSPDPDPEYPVFPSIPALQDRKSPKIITYVDVQKNNPLNLTSYHLGASADGPVFTDLCILNVAEIRKDPNGDPTLYLNADINAVLSNANSYIRPLQNAGAGVLLLVWGGNAGIGVANMTQTQADVFTDLLVGVIGQYGLNGVAFDDEYANYQSVLSGSWSNVIKLLRTKFDTYFPNEGRLITVQQWGNYSQIDAEAGAIIDYADHGSLGANVFLSSSSINGVTKDRWTPQSIMMGNQYNTIYLNQIKNRSLQAFNGGYGAIMMEDVRPAADVNPLPVFQKIAEGAFDSTVTYDGDIYSRDWTQTASLTISKETYTK